MILVDANLLIYAYNTGDPRHEAARTWLEKVLSGTEPVRFAWQSLLAFVRITTGPKPFARPLRFDDAMGYVASWLDQPCAGVLDPTERHVDLLAKMGTAAQARGAIVMDAHLAALAVEHRATLYTTDRDFARFEDLDVVDPLRPSGSD